jgi:hypothetical protein
MKHSMGFEQDNITGETIAISQLFFYLFHEDLIIMQQLSLYK